MVTNTVLIQWRNDVVAAASSDGVTLVGGPDREKRSEGAPF